MERALRLKDEFLANMSHELRTPLNAVMGISESLLGQTIGKLNEKQKKYISTINESGAHLLSLINDILDLSKIEAGRMELDITDISINSLFESSYRMVKEMAHKKNINISFEIGEHAQNVHGDLRRLLQMLVNLLSNAVKFTPVGGKAGVQAFADPDLNEIRITVWDTGIGIADEDIPRLFQSFVQLDSSLSREYSGTGLGLMLVMQMVRMHGGNISVQSKLDEGSRFTISLPWSLAESNSAASEEIENAAPSSTLGKMRVGNILLIEDTESIVMLVDDYLQAHGHRVLIAKDGLSGLMMAKDEHADLILLDVQMPGMDGFEVIEKLRADASLKDIPVIALTALAMPGDRERCLAAGMNDYMSKPIRLKELTRMIEQYLQHADAKSEGQ
jgi:CheY-like chemotaxis protein